MKSAESTATDTHCQSAFIPVNNLTNKIMDKIRDIETGDWQPCCDDQEGFVDCETIISSPLFWLNISIGFVVGGSVLYLMFGSSYDNDRCPIHIHTHD